MGEIAWDCLCCVAALRTDGQVGAFEIGRGGNGIVSNGMGNSGQGGRTSRIHRLW